MVALIPRIKKYLEKNPATIPLYGIGFVISAAIIAVGFFMVSL